MRAPRRALRRAVQLLMGPRGTVRVLLAFRLSRRHTRALAQTVSEQANDEVLTDVGGVRGAGRRDDVAEWCAVTGGGGGVLQVLAPRKGLASERTHGAL